MLIDQQALGALRDAPRLHNGDLPGACAEPPVRDHLQRVDALLQDRLRDLIADWSASVPAAVRTAELPSSGSGNGSSPQPASSIDLPRQLDSLISAGGKRLRPVFGFLGFWAGGGVPGSAAEDELIKVGAALEFLHTFALVQDDVMDQSATRRGRPAAHAELAGLHRDLGGSGDHQRYGESLAVLLGDLAHAEATRLVAECRAPVRTRWHQLIIELINGQARDLAGSAWRSGDTERALLIARMKSGGYTVQRPVELGAVVAGAAPDRLQLLTAYGRDLGTAFALRDDVLGVWGDPETTGKPAGDDLVAGKPTMIIARATDRLGDLPQTHRIGTAELTPADVGTLQQAMTDCGIRAELETMIGEHLDRALAALDSLPEDAAATMSRLAHEIAWRDR